MMMLFHPSSRLKLPVIHQSVCMERVLEQRGRALAHPSSKLVGTVVTSRGRMYALFDCLHVPPLIVVHLSCRMRLHAN